MRAIVYTLDSDGIKRTIVAGYEEDGSTVCIIPDGVTRIPHGVFMGCKNLTKIIFPKSLLKVGGYVCYYCENLTDITLPNSIQHMSTTAFIGCDNIKNVKVKSYYVYELLNLLKGLINKKLELCVIISTIKNYYSKTYTKEEIHNLIEYIRENRIRLFPYAMNNSDLYNFMFNEIDKIYNTEDVNELFNKIDSKEEKDKGYDEVTNSGEFLFA